MGWSFGPNSPCGSIASTTIGTTHPTLIPRYKLDFLPLRRLIDDQYHFLDYLELAELELGTHELFQDKYHVMNHSEMYMYDVALGGAV